MIPQTVLKEQFYAQEVMSTYSKPQQILLIYMDNFCVNKPSKPSYTKSHDITNTNYTYLYQNTPLSLAN
jgi:hypothetical protein